MRPLTDQDILKVQELFRSTVLTVNSKDYTKEEVEENDAPKKRDPRRAYFGVAQVGSESDREYGKRRTHAAGIAKITDFRGKNDSARGSHS